MAKRQTKNKRKRSVLAPSPPQMVILRVCMVLLALLLAAITLLNRGSDTVMNTAYPRKYDEYVTYYAGKYQIDPYILYSIIRTESNFNPQAESNVGARGLMQLMPDTAEWIAGKIGDSNYSFDHLYDAETNIRYGCWYLNYLSKLFRGDAVLVSSAYHAGQTTVTHWLSDKGISSDGVTIPVDKLPDGPTKQYAGRVTTSYGIYEALLYPNESAEAAGAADGDIVSARAVRAGVANQ